MKNSYKCLIIKIKVKVLVITINKIKQTTQIPQEINHCKQFKWIKVLVKINLFQIQWITKMMKHNLLMMKLMKVVLMKYYLRKNQHGKAWDEWKRFKEKLFMMYKIQQRNIKKLGEKLLMLKWNLMMMSKVVQMNKKLFVHLILQDTFIKVFGLIKMM